MTALKLFLIQHWYPRGKTDSDLALAIGVDQSMVSRWVAGKAEPSIERKIDIARALLVDSRLVFPEKVN